VQIIDAEGTRVGVYNLTDNDLSDPDHYDELRAMLLDAAER